MSPMEKMEEIVRALEEVADEGCAYTVGCPPGGTRRTGECGSCKASRALTLARELRDNAVEGWCGDYQFMSKQAYPDQIPALLILSEPTP